MSTIYWIEMLDGIVSLLLISGAIVFIIGIVMTISSYGGEEYGEKYEENLPLRKNGIKTLLVSAFILVLFALIPSTKQAYIIWGVGGTIEYLKNNKDAEQLPDKTLNILNKWADNYLENDSIKLNK